MTIRLRLVNNHSVVIVQLNQAIIDSNKFD